MCRLSAYGYCVHVPLLQVIQTFVPRLPVEIVTRLRARTQRVPSGTIATGDRGDSLLVCALMRGMGVPVDAYRIGERSLFLSTVSGLRLSGDR